MKLRKLSIALVASFAFNAIAQTAPNAPPSPTFSLDKATGGEPLLIGVRGSSIPVSYRDPTNPENFVGLSVDVCIKAINELKTKFPKINYKFVEVTSSNRIEFLNSGKIDLECGSTTSNKSRKDGNEKTKGPFAPPRNHWLGRRGLLANRVTIRTGW